MWVVTPTMPLAGRPMDVAMGMAWVKVAGAATETELLLMTMLSMKIWSLDRLAPKLKRMPVAPTGRFALVTPTTPRFELFG